MSSCLGEGLLHTGKAAEAIAEFEKAVELSEGSPDVLAMLGHAYAAAGGRRQAEEILARLTELSRHRYVPSWDMALIHLTMGDTEEAFRWLDAAYAERAQGLAHIKVDPHLDPIRSDPRFQDLSRRVGITP